VISVTSEGPAVARLTVRVYASQRKPVAAGHGVSEPYLRRDALGLSLTRLAIGRPWLRLGP
jgi:hypothetical protein